MTLYVYILRRHIPVILITTIVAVVIAALLTWRMPKVYTAGTKLRVVPFGISRPDYGTYLYFEQLSATFIAMLRSYSVREEARTQLQLDELPSFEVGVIPQSDLLQITVTDQNRELAQRVANVLADILTKRTSAQYIDSITNVETLLGARTKELEKEITQLIQEQTRLINEIPRNNVRIAEIERTLETRQATYDQLLTSYNQALVAQATQMNVVAVVEPATLPVNSSGPNQTLNLLAGTVAGLVGGLALAILIELFRPGLYQDEQIEQVIKAPVIGKLPVIRKALRDNVFAAEGAPASAFRHLRAYLLSHSDPTNTETSKVILFTGTRPHAGTSTVAANLARAMQHIGKQVILVDAHLLAPTQPQRFGLKTEPGLAEVLDKQLPLADVIQKTPASEIHFLAAGQNTATTIDLLASPAMAALLCQLKSQYDIIIMDTPAVVSSSDAIALGTLADQIVLVMKPHSVRQTAEKAQRELVNVCNKLVGVVINPT